MNRKTLALVAVLLWPAVGLAQAPAGGEFLVNTYTTGHQYFPAAAFDRAGNFVVVWSSYDFVRTPYGPTVGQVDVIGQRYAAGGVRVGGEFRINTSTTYHQYANQGTPISMRADGRFVVVWTDNFVGAASRIQGQRFEADGSKSGAEFTIPGFGDSYEPSVAVAPNGTFVVVWSGDAPATNIQAQRFDAGGNALGPFFRVNNQTFGVQRAPRIAMDGQGGFVVTWQDRFNLDGSGHGVFAQRFGPDGVRQGQEFQVNTYTTGNQYLGSVARTPDGRFIVLWDGPNDGSGFGVFAQRYDAVGAPIGGEFQVNSVTSGGQSYPAVAVDDHFRFAASWQSTTADGSGFGVRARRFDELGAPRGSEFLVNTYTTRSQQAPHVAMDDVGNVLVAWQSDRQEDFPPGPNALQTDHLGVFAQRHDGLHPRTLRVDTPDNAVLEPGETARLLPGWLNVTSAAALFGTLLTDPEGPPGGIPLIVVPNATYDLPVGATGEPVTWGMIEIPNPSPRPAVHWDGAVTETVIGNAAQQRKRWLLHVGASFSDVPVANPFYRFIETLLHHGVTGGCTPSTYCPAGVTTREQMAVFVLAAKEGPGYTPPACAAPLFADVPASSPFCRWIEELARRGVVGGCGGGNYCPAAPVNREQMAVFVLRTAEPTRTPPACAPPNTFADVPDTSPFCRWIEELARRAIVGGCGGGNYCPLLAVTRDQMGVFISGTFALALYGL